MQCGDSMIKNETFGSMTTSDLSLPCSNLLLFLNEDECFPHLLFEVLILSRWLEVLRLVFNLC